MPRDNVNINMSSPTNRIAKPLCKTTEHFNPVQNSIHVQKPCTPKKEDSTCTQTKKSLKSTDCVSDVGHNNSFLDNSEKLCTQTSSSIVVKEISQKEAFSGVSSCGCVETAQSEPSGIQFTKKPTRQENQYSPESLKEHTAKNPSEGKEENIAQLNSHLPCEYKNFEGNSCEGTTITETSVLLPLNTSTDCCTDNAVDKKKERWRMMKKLAKDEKRKQRELEYKKNLQYPKGQRIQVIDHCAFQKILTDAGSFNNENKKSLLNTEEFPTLNVLKSNNRVPLRHWQDPLVQSDTEKSNVQDKTTHNMGKFTKVPETCFVTNGEMISKTEKPFGVPNILSTKGSPKKIGKLPKKRDPIQIDILQCIKIVKSKDAVVEPRKKLSALERRKDSSLISGNELDSSNPQRSRGKKRENPKKKRPTRLKLVILRERKRRNQLKKLEESSLSQTEKASFSIEKTSNLLTAGNSKSEVLEPVTNVLDNEVVKTVSKVDEVLNERRYKCEEPSSESITGVAVPDLMPSLRDSASEALKKEKEEFTSAMKESCYTVDVKQDQHSLASAAKLTHISSAAVKREFLHNSQDSLETVSFTDPDTCNKLHPVDCKNYPQDKVWDNSSGSKETMQKTEIHSTLKKEKEEFTQATKESCYTVDLKQDQHSLASAAKLTQISSAAVKHEFLHNSQDSQETVSFSDPDTCNKLHPMGSKNFPQDKVWDSSSGSTETIQKTEIHSRKFRPYCDHFITPEINSSVSALLHDIVKFHDRQFLKDPVKANARRRHVTGLREVLKYLNLKRLKLIIIAPDLELIQGKGGICDIVEQLKEGAQNQDIPYVFALHRRALGKTTFKKVPVSCVGIINYDGTEKNFHSLVAALNMARAQYQEAITNISLKAMHSEEVDINKQVIEAALSRLTENSSTSCSEQSHICSETVQKWEE